MAVTAASRVLYAAAMVVSARVTDLYRYPVKGLSGDALKEVRIAQKGETFPDDRRFALLEQANKDQWQGDNWLHKENFLCAFTEPELLARYQSSYCINSPEQDISRGLPCDALSPSPSTQRLLNIAHRSTDRHLVGPLDLAQESGRQELACFLGQESGRDVLCITAKSDAHTHQFGNTSSGWKQRRDTRTVHIVNRQTIQEFSNAIGVPLNPCRFRPNIVMDGVPAWSEFDWVSTTGDKCLVEPTSGLKLTVINRTVRCKGVSVDPTESGTRHVLDIPSLLAKHFPEHGPYLGVYAVIDSPGKIAIGDELRLIEASA